MQIFLAGYIVIEICEIFTVGGFPLDNDVRKVGFFFFCPSRHCLLTLPLCVGILGRPPSGYHSDMLDSSLELASQLPDPR